MPNTRLQPNAYAVKKSFTMSERTWRKLLKIMRRYKTKSISRAMQQLIEDS